MAYEIPRIINATGRTIKIAHLDLPSEPSSFLSADIAAAGTAVTILDNNGFADTHLTLIGEKGKETTEVKDITAAVTAGTSITVTAVTFKHSKGTPIRRVLFDQLKVYGNATDTTTGATLIATIDIQYDAEYTTYVNAGTEYAYYFVTPYDSVNAVTGTSSDGIAATGNLDNSVGNIINKALTSTKKDKGGVITDEWLMGEIDDCMEYVSNKLKKFSYLQSYDTVLGQVLRGTYQFTLPTDINENEGLRSILAVKSGAGLPLTQRDEKEWDSDLDGVILDTVRVEASAADTTLKINNSYDFSDSGSVNVYVSGTQYNLTYTGVTRSATAGVLTGVPAADDGAITVTIPVGTNVWYGETEGVPLYYNIAGGELKIWPLANSTNDKMNLYLDYFTKRTKVNSAGDVIDTKRYLVVKHWLCWKLRSLDNATGTLDMNDGDKIMFDTVLRDLIRTEIHGQKYKMIPKVNFVRY